MSSFAIVLYLLCCRCYLVAACTDGDERILLDNISQPQSVITSLHHPDYYPPKVLCYFYITAPEGWRVRIYFTAFQLESTGGFDICLYDSLTVYDGDSIEDRTFGRFCGIVAPPAMVSSGRHLSMKFETDGSIEDTGFKAIVQIVPQDYEEPRPTSSPGSCYTILEETSGVFHSPGFPGSYDHNQDCTFVVILPDQSDKVLLRFTSFDLEPSQLCMYDYVEVRDGLSLSTPLIGRYCGGTINAPLSVIESSGPGIYVLFHTDVSASFEGFYAEYAASSINFMTWTRNTGEALVTSVCDISHAILTERGGFIVSHDGYPRGTYDHNLSCTVQFVGSRYYEKVFINFLSVDLPASSSCSVQSDNDHIEFIDGHVTDHSSTSGVLCGSQVHSFTSSSQHATVKFHTDSESNDGHNGFRALYSIFYQDVYGCADSDFHCDNNHCIDPSLVCDGYDHCADDSDEVKGCTSETDFPWLGIVGIVLGCLLLGMLAICCVWRLNNGQMTRTTTNVNSTSRHHASNGTALAVISSNNSQPFSHQNPAFSPDISLAPIFGGGDARAEPPPYSLIRHDASSPPQNQQCTNISLPSAPGPAFLYPRQDSPRSPCGAAFDPDETVPHWVSDLKTTEGETGSDKLDIPDKTLSRTLEMQQ